ncbi:MAG: MBOAT family protein [Kiritimatiellae bacterium]|nr:MBOAT family protein [Kiritimatiellia bacterium]MDW8458067.1 MBOAT family protein [Verrucomicrobiota bacterium]
MVFSSHLFLFYFLPLALGIYALTPRRLRALSLTLLSYVFYGWANPLFCALLLFSTAVDYACGRALVGWRSITEIGDLPLLEPGGPRSRRQRALVAVSVITNLGLLGFFKYFNFGVDSLNAALVALGLEPIGAVLEVALPLGISFYTFQSMSYTIDVYRGRAAPQRHFIDFACYVALFPQLVAGPIIRYHELADQIRARTHTWEKAARGIALFLIGLTKKICLANPCGKVADTAFSAAELHALDAWLGLVAYAFQIYFDFSGYSDMAIGLGLILGFTFPKNFDSPYRSESITEFWRRWHISLSAWLRDYLYIPLGGNRISPRRTYINLLVVMLLGGLWHGASWTFVVWGAIHGLLLAVERALGQQPIYRRLPRPLRIALTFGLVCIAWVFFRAESVAHAADYLCALVGARCAGDAAWLAAAVIRHPVYLSIASLAAALVWYAPQSTEWTRRLSAVKLAAAAALGALSVAVMTVEEFNPFIYFIF